MKRGSFLQSLVSDAIKSKNKVESRKEPEQSLSVNNSFDRTSLIKWFSELDKNSGAIAGGKGANLAEMYNLGVQVPPGFVVTAQAYNYFIEKAEIKEKIHELLDRINYEDTKQLDQITQQIRAFIVDSRFPKDLEEEIIEAYETLDVDLPKKGESNYALNLLKAGAEPVFVAVRSSATAEDLEGASFAGQQDTYLNVKGNSELLKNIKKCFASLFTSRATYYRNKKGFDHTKVSLAVVVQKMIDSEKSGVMFSKDPSYKNNNLIIEAVWGLGEGIVSGTVTPDKYILSQELELIDKKILNKRLAITRDSSGAKAVVKLKTEIANAQVLKNHELRRLGEIALKLEEHYQKPQDIEFAIEGEEIYIVQTRPITTIETRVSSSEIKEIKGEPILTGLAASPGIASGKVKIIEDLEDLDKINIGDVLVTKMTNPDMVVTMQKSSAIITDEGGLTAHAAIVSREMGIPCIVGTSEATTLLKEGEIVTVDGFTGKIYKGKTAETVQKEVLPITAETKTKIKVTVDLPSFAERAAKTGAEKVGLTRIEGIISESGKHPKYFLDKNRIKDYEEIIFKGISGIAEHFSEIWVRTSDIRTDEFQNLEGAPKEKEANPMLGSHGIRYSLKNPEILKAELNAMNRVANKGKTIGILMPQLISLEELQSVKKILQELNITNLKLGVMIETPAAVQIIKELCEEGLNFISFGTNDLTQYILAIDRGNQEVQDLYNEMHPAVLYQLGYVIRICKRYNVETSICGQAGSKKEMVEYLVKQGIDSISVNADAAKEISDYVAELEKNILREKGEEPRKYQPEKREELQKEKYEKESEERLLQETNTIEKIKENIQESIEKTEEILENIADKLEPEKEEEFYHQTLKEPKEFTEDELPVINGLDHLKEKKLDIF